MKPPRFTYHSPTTMAEALGLLAEHQQESKLLAGGQSLMPVLNMRLARPAQLIDLRLVPDLDALSVADTLAVGAMVRQRRLEEHPAVRAGWPLLHAALLHIAHPTIRNRGTVGGSLAHADPAAELPLAAVALEAELELTSVRGTRRVAAAQFFCSYFMTAAGPDEVLTAIYWPPQPGGRGWSFQEVARRHGDFALVAAACTVDMDANGRCRAVRLAIGGCAPTPLRIAAAEAALTGSSLAPADLDQAAAAVTAVLDPESDLHGSRQYRREVAGKLTRRALSEALARAAGAKEVEST